MQTGAQAVAAGDQIISTIFGQMNAVDHLRDITADDKEKTGGLRVLNNAVTLAGNVLTHHHFALPDPPDGQIHDCAHRWIAPPHRGDHQRRCG